MSETLTENHRRNYGECLDRERGHLERLVATEKLLLCKTNDHRELARRHKVASRITTEHIARQKAFIGELVKALALFVDDEECEFDHHGNCQTHSLGNPCEQSVARALLANPTRVAR